MQYFKTMKLTATALFLVLTIGTTYGQILKSYSGRYAGGQATYQYYENTDLERIFSGKFSYNDTKDNVNLSGVHIPSGTEINGTFKENLKNGMWTAKEVLSSVVPGYGNTKVTMIYSGNYLNGKQTGQWVYKQSLTSNKGVENHNAILNFNDNVLIGAVDFSGLKGNFDNQGNFIQNWNVKDEGTEYIAEFKNNVFLKLIKRRVSDGQILYRYDNQNTANLFLENQKGKQKIIETNGKRYLAVDCDKLEEFY